jgi:hypothetical protein
MEKRANKMTDNPRRPTAHVVSVSRTATGGEEVVIRTETGRVETVTTTPSSVAAMDRAVEAYSRALKNLAKR